MEKSVHADNDGAEMRRREGGIVARHACARKRQRPEKRSRPEKSLPLRARGRPESLGSSEFEPDRSNRV